MKSIHKQISRLINTDISLQRSLKRGIVNIRALAKTLIEEHSARQKWVILLSDGKPNDYDKYEGKYGLADVKKALGELNEMHISTHAFAIEEQARYYLPLMFGSKQYNVLSNYREMLYSLSALCERIVKG